MSTPQLIIDNEKERALFVEEMKKHPRTSLKSSAGSRGGPTDVEMERRVRYLENSFERIDGKLDKLLAGSSVFEVRLATIDAKLDAKAGIVEVGKIETRLAAIDAKLDGKAGQSELSFITGKISAFVDKWFVLKTNFYVFGAITSVITALTLFQTYIKAALGLH